MKPQPSIIQMWNASNKDLMNSITLSPLLAHSGRLHYTLMAPSGSLALPGSALQRHASAEQDMLPVCLIARSTGLGSKISSKNLPFQNKLLLCDPSHSLYGILHTARKVRENLLIAFQLPALCGLFLPLARIWNYKELNKLLRLLSFSLLLAQNGQTRRPMSAMSEEQTFGMHTYIEVS